MGEPTLWSFISNDSFVVKLVISLLFLASIASWAIIFQRLLLLLQTRKEIKKFEHLFWSGSNLTTLYHQLAEKKNKLSSTASIFFAGLNEFSRLRQESHPNPEAVLEGTQRAMRIAQRREVDFLERNLNFLATVGSTSPYVGLFGTVWGIMTSFRALGAVQQITISMVAPGISEALIATAAGLFAAIPAVIAYNRFTNELEQITQAYDNFQEEFLILLHRKSYNARGKNAQASIS
ncbi:protein TolQ [Coxiella-like endosymbiont of Rhipicephalus sanguineus]|uniref:protein TolQ n=1 Tax=Coxiella-like endosymbiont of Rhipicephalus sanguineus TaxID=1955402 RepID=UPI00203AFA81|nr:protein TolQ [Coxiella-like endosymbiont of Rhipicephalus sanguineus]MBT8506610.1 protein TolQ [Coxiella-like endosymbiont of Rhipicephalus sanguineus]